MSRIYREATQKSRWIKNLSRTGSSRQRAQKFGSMDRPSCQEAIEVKSINLDRRNLCQAVVEMLSRRYREATQKSRWIENLSRMYRANKEHRNLALWIDLDVKKLSRSNPEISIEETCVKLLSRCCRETVEKTEARFSKGRKAHKMNATR